MGHHGFVTELVPEYEAWADQAFACGPAPMLAALSRLAAGRRERLGVAKLGRKRGGGKADPIGSPAARRKTFLQVSMEQNMGCAVGACLGCVVMSVTGTPQRVCREGPVFASDEMRWEGAWCMTPEPPCDRLAIWAGLIGASVIAIGSVVTALAYTGSKGQSYSPLNHFVSELGQLSVSRLAVVFNTSLIVGGVCFVVFILGLAAAGQGWLRYVYGLVGVIAGIGGALVGVFPMD